MWRQKNAHYFILFPFEMRFYLFQVFFFLSFFDSKLVKKRPLAKTLNFSFCKRLLNLAVFKCSGWSVFDFSRRSLNHKGLEWVIQMAQVLMAIFFKGDLFSPLAFLSFPLKFFIVFFFFFSLQERQLATSQGQITDDMLC